MRERATEEALRTLVPAGQWNRKGTPEWAGIEDCLAREPKESFPPLRTAMQQYPTIVYHTTAWRMTWVFVDGAGIVRGYYLCAQ